MVDSLGYIYAKVLLSTDTLPLRVSSSYKTLMAGDTLTLLQYAHSPEWVLAQDLDLLSFVPLFMGFLGLLTAGLGGVWMLYHYKNQASLWRCFREGSMQELIGRVITLKEVKGRKIIEWHIFIQYQKDKDSTLQGRYRQAKGLCGSFAGLEQVFKFFAYIAQYKKELDGLISWNFHISENTTF